MTDQTCSLYALLATTAKLDMKPWMQKRIRGKVKLMKTFELFMNLGGRGGS
jgi:hypothetical protein